MKELPRILFIEPSAAPASSARQNLEAAGIKFTGAHAASREEVLRALSAFQPELVISKGSLPDLDEMEALRLSYCRDPRLPFLFYTDAKNAETAVQCLSAGAIGYISTKHPARLAAAVCEALEKGKPLRNSRPLKSARETKFGAEGPITAINEDKPNEQALRLTEKRYRFLNENINDIISTSDEEGTYTYISQSHYKLLGRGREVLGRSVFEHIHPDELASVRKILSDAFANGAQAKATYSYLHPSRGYIWLKSTGQRHTETIDTTSATIITRDISERKSAVEALRINEAIQICRETTKPIALLLTDIIMPEMNGKALENRVALLRPGIKVLFMSGYNEDVIARNGVIEERVEFIQKPFSKKELSTKIRRVLDH